MSAIRHRFDVDSNYFIYFFLNREKAVYFYVYLIVVRAAASPHYTNGARIFDILFVCRLSKFGMGDRLCHSKIGVYNSFFFNAAVCARHTGQR